METMVASRNHRFMSVRALALHAQPVGKVSGAKPEAGFGRQGKRVLVDPQLLGVSDERVRIPNLLSRNPTRAQDFASRNAILL